MTPDKTRRIATATGFLDALREAPGFWPPDLVWTALSRPHRLELAGGIATMVVTFVTSLRRRPASDH
jgi:hypothetical protein